MVSHFGELIRVEREGEEEEGEENQRNVWKFRFLYGKIIDFSMKCLEFVYETLDDFYIFVWENQTINSFLINLSLKEPYFVYWWCFGFGLVDCNPHVRNICIKKILGF